MLEIKYPIESFFFPYNPIIVSITSIIFFIIIFSLRKYHGLRDSVVKAGNGEERKNRESLNKADAIALGGLIIGIVVTGLYPFLQAPLVDYSVTLSNIPSNNDSKEINIVLENFGLDSAKNVIVSLNIIDELNRQIDRVNFIKFKSMPFISTYLNQSNSTAGKGFVEIDNIPPRAKISLTAPLQEGESNTTNYIVPYVR